MIVVSPSGSQIKSLEKNDVPSVVLVRMDGGKGEKNGRRPFQLVFTCGATERRVVRAMIAVGESRQYQLPFIPDRITATEFQFVTPAAISRGNRILNVDSKDVHEWTPELSLFSRHRAQLISWTQIIFKRTDVARFLMSNHGMSFSRAPRYLKSFPDAEAKRLLAYVKSDFQCPPEICARYARLLARLYCWPLPKGADRALQLKNDESRLELAEAMLPLLPRDNESYFELGNASFQHKFRDAVIGDALYRVARIRLRRGETQLARDLLRLHVQLLPANVKTNLTEDRIRSILTEDDLDQGLQDSDSKAD